MTNKEFAEKDQGFKDACIRVKLPNKPMAIKRGSKAISVGHAGLGLGRQAGKWRRKVGLAYRDGRSVTAAII